MRLVTVGVTALVGVNSLNIFQTHRDASSALSRGKRSNGGIFEELLSSNIQRECIEEACSFDEVEEALGDKAAADKWWDEATSMCNKKDSCYAPGTKLCTNLWRKRKCTCKIGWINTKEADDCSTDLNECDTENFCGTGACNNEDGGYNCDCTNTGFTGDRCELDLNECEEANPCQNGSSCTNNEGSYTCSCASGWTGTNCEIDINECDAEVSPCQNDSGCINSEGSYRCLCTNGFGGQNCDEDFSECGNGLCPVGTICQELGPNEFTCSCPARGCNNLNETLYEMDLASVWSDPDLIVEYNEMDEESGNSTSTDEGVYGGEDSENPDVSDYTDNYGEDKYDNSTESGSNSDNSDDSSYANTEYANNDYNQSDDSQDGEDQASYNGENNVDEPIDNVYEESPLLSSEDGGEDGGESDEGAYGSQDYS